MTLVWFVIWLVSSLVGDDEVLTWDPVNVWVGTLLLAIALDLSRQHVAGSSTQARTAGRRHREP